MSHRLKGQIGTKEFVDLKNGSINSGPFRNPPKFMNLATKLTVLCAFSNVAMVPLVYW